MSPDRRTRIRLNKIALGGGAVGHVVNSDREYRLLQQRLDRTITGAPASPVLDRIVRMLYRPDDVDLAVQIPFRITPLPKLAKKTGIPEDDLCNRLTEMAGRGLMLDFEYRDEHYVALPPLILGFFEFTFMRARDELPMAELAALFEEYSVATTAGKERLPA